MAAETEDKKVFATLVFIRHGESEWNAANKFTGWVDCDLSELGKEEAIAGGKTLKEAKFEFDVMYTSYLKRAIKTGNMVLAELEQLWVPVVKTWRLNERMYGGLQGLNKTETTEKFGNEKVLVWRRSFDVPPPPIEEDSPYNPTKDKKYKDLDPKDIPKTECLKDVITRAMPCWDNEITESLKKGETVLVAAHGNSIRAIVKYLDDIPDDVIPGLEIPTGIPLVYEFDKDLKLIPSSKAIKPLSGQFLADPKALKEAQDKVKHQTSKK